MGPEPSGGDFMGGVAVFRGASRKCANPKLGALITRWKGRGAVGGSSADSGGPFQRQVKAINVSASATQISNFTPSPPATDGPRWGSPGSKKNRDGSSGRRPDPTHSDPARLVSKWAEPSWDG